MSEKLKKYLKNSIDEKGNYCYSLPVETTKAVIKEIERLNNIIKEVRNQLSYLETYSSKEDVFEDMKRRLDRIEKIIGSDKE